LGYANANGQLYAQAVAALALVFVSRRSRRGRICAAGAACLFVLAALRTGSLGGALTAFALAGWMLLARRVRRPAPTVLAMAAAVTISIAATIALGADQQPGGSASIATRMVDKALTTRRPILWHEALMMIRSQPVRGVGPERFQAESATSRSDRDARWAHSAVLQQAAETGLVGAALLVSLAAVGFALLLVSPQPTAVVVVGAAGLTSLLLHASMDYILHFAWLPITAAALLGAATASRRAEHEEGSERGSPKVKAGITGR
jgi:O-antigen ligase